MGNNINNIIRFYKNYYKDLNIATLRSDFFILILEFDIVARFNFRPNLKDLKIIIKAIEEKGG